MPRTAKTPREIDILSPEEVRTLIHLVSRRSPTGVRNRALLAVLYGAGLRIAEALALRPKDLDLDRLTVRVHRGKGSKARTAALNPGAAPYVERWLDKRRQLGLRGTQPLFCTITTGFAGAAETRPGRPLSDAYVRGFDGDPAGPYGVTLVEWSGLVDDLMGNTENGRVTEAMIDTLIEAYADLD